MATKRLGNALYINKILEKLHSIFRAALSSEARKRESINLHNFCPRALANVN